MSRQTRQLIESINDQYVLLAADPAATLADLKQKKKKNRAKIFAIGAAAAAMYIIITVAIIISTLTPPDNPVTPPASDPTDPGTQDQPGEPGDADDSSEPELNLPDAEFFEQHLSGFWKCNTWISQPYPDTGIPDSVIVLNFQSDGRAYVFEEIDGKSTLGKYSVADDHIQIYTLDSEQQWVLYGKMKISTQSDQTHLYAGDLIFDRIKDTNAANLSIRGTLEAAETEVDIRDFYIGSIRFDTRAFDFGHIAPVYSEHTSMKFDRAPSFFVGQADTVNYKIYDKHMELLEEGAQKIDIEGSFYLGALEENGLYYVELSCMYTSRSAIREIELCYFLTIQVGEEKTDEPVTPPEYTITLPDEPYLDYLRCMGEVYGMWTDGEWMTGEVKEIIYYFTPGGYFYQLNMKTWESILGVYYYYADGTILMFEANDKGEPIRQMSCYAKRSEDGNGKGTITMLTVEDNTTLGTYSLYRTRPTSELLEVQIEGKWHFIPYMLPEAFIWDEDDDDKFEFDTSFFLEKIQSIPHLAITSAPAFRISLVGESATYTLYVKEPGMSYPEIIDEGELVESGSRLLLPDTLDVSWDDEGTCYYVDIRYETGGYNTYCNHQFMRYFVALQCVGDEEESYTPPKSTTDSILIESCDTQPKGAFELDTTNPVEGEGCWSITTPAAGALAFHAWENGIDASGCDVIEFDLYISDLAALEAMKKNCALELSSSETCDIQEIAFSGQLIVELGRYGQEWQVGWNHVVLRLKDATATNGAGSGSGKEAASFDIANVNFVRFYLLTATTSHTIKIDNICLSIERK